MFVQGIKKETKSIEDLCEGLEFIQEAYRDESIAEGMRERLPVEQRVGLAQRLANVEQSCRIQADTITQKNQVRPHKAEKDVVAPLVQVSRLALPPGRVCPAGVAAEHDEGRKHGGGDCAESGRRGAARVEAQAAAGLRRVSGEHLPGPPPELVGAAVSPHRLEDAAFMHGVMLHAQVHLRLGDAPGPAGTAAEAAAAGQEVQRHRCLQALCSPGGGEKSCRFLDHQAAEQVSRRVQK